MKIVEISSEFHQFSYSVEFDDFDSCGGLNCFTKNFYFIFVFLNRADPKTKTLYNNENVVYQTLIKT